MALQHKYGILPKKPLKLLEATLYNYKSIVEAHIKFQSDITCLVGMTGAGKTSILELLQRINVEFGFNQRDLSEGSKTLDDFINNRIQADKILQLDAKFEIDETDKPALPPEYENVTTISIKRFFDGVLEIDRISTGIDIPFNIDDELGKIKLVLQNLHSIIEQHESKIPNIKDHIPYLINHRNELIWNIQEMPLNSESFLQNFKTGLFAIPHDQQLKNAFSQAVGLIEVEIHAILEKSKGDPNNIVYDLVVPKPKYIAQLDTPIDSIPIDEYLNNKETHETFRAIGHICGFTKNGLNSIRNDESHRKQNFFENASKTLTTEFGKFWTQTEYELIVSLNEQNLTFGVKDAISGKTTGVTQRSEGLQWVLSLFFKIKLLASSRGLSHILLLDSPATAIHDAGKEEIRKFMTKMSEENDLQIVYTTHEKALIDAWRLDRIRFVDKTSNKGTVIEEVKTNGIDSTRIEISKYIGSPAKYSLFGAPITVLFEGPSDYRFIAALNEYAIKNDMKHLHPDVYTIDDMGGIDNAPNTTRILRGLGVEYICVVDGGSKTKTIQNKIEGDKFTKSFIQITEVVEKDAADIEDLIDPRLYEYLFKKAHPDTDVANHGDDVLANQKTVNYYSNILRKKPSEYNLNKPVIASLLMNVINNTPPELEEPLRNTMKRYEKLVGIIEAKASNIDKDDPTR